MHEILTTYAGSTIIIILMAIYPVAFLIGWIVSPRFREGWRRRTLFDDTFGFNFWNENRWFLLLTIVVFVAPFLLLFLGVLAGE